MHAAGVQLDEEEHLVGLQQQRLHREEITGQHPCGLGA